MFCIILKTSSEVLLKWNGFSMTNLHNIKKQILSYLWEALGSLIKSDSAKFEKKSLKMFAVVFLSTFNALLLSTALKFETSVFFGMSRDFKVSDISFGFPICSESLSSIMFVFFV